MPPVVPLVPLVPAFVVAELLLIVQLLIFTVPVERTRMPPPVSLVALPLAIVRPDRVTLTIPVPIFKTRTALLPLTVSMLAPGPVIVRFLFTASSLASVIGLVTVAISKSIVSPAAAVAIACRSVHVVLGQAPPESALLLTVIVAAGVESVPEPATIQRWLGTNACVGMTGNV